MKKNRHILSLLNNAICFLVKLGLSVRELDETDSLQNKGKYVEFLNYTSEYDGQLEDYLKPPIIFIGTSSQFKMI